MYSTNKFELYCTHSNGFGDLIFNIVELWIIWNLDYLKTYKANLRDLIVATGLAILLKLDSNLRLFARVTLKFDGWPWQIIRHVLYTTSSFVYHVISISEFKLESQSENGPSGSNSTIFFSCVTLRFDSWLWKTIGHFFHATSRFVHYLVAIVELKFELQSGNAEVGSNSMILEPCDLEIWLMTLKIIGQLFNATSSFVHHFVAIGDFKLEIQSGNAQFGSKSTIFGAVWPCNLTYKI